MKGYVNYTQFYKHAIIERAPMLSLFAPQTPVKLGNSS